ncbi:GNAT family N-acetyltransferase [Hyphobacterium sp. CCMP332]|uniref:GNAT family N-acetyltransferase n=1 Tax=Hyphobacterium sp. CCMP332 TaxID=2749086 RepID=UPI00164F2AD9|nr:GNAT family N-acetyltransferase [Hyphobacterium sp. CCMP332]QNL19435.1 GNAT family N-acetyltransferase [Hyphobacterium sp. CCMP332]
MRVKSVSIRDLSSAELGKWRDWAYQDGQLVSPYLLPDFAAAVDRVRSDVRVAVIEQDEQTVGYFAFHAPRHFALRPVGAPMSDYQGIVSKPGVSICPNEFLTRLGAGFMAYENWWNGAGCKVEKARERDGSVIVDLSDGSDAYFAERMATHKSQFKKMDRRLRNAERDFGPARLVVGDGDGQLLATLNRWKSEQYNATRKLDVFDIDWARQLLVNLNASNDAGFQGLTFALYFGDELAAVEFGLRAGDVYHSWFPAYDERFAKVSPGLLLLHEIFKAAPELGLNRVDLGKGGAHYKTYYASYEVPLDSGRVIAPSFSALGLRSWDVAEQCARILPGKLSELPVRARRRWSQVSAFEPDMAARLRTFSKFFRSPTKAA